MEVNAVKIRNVCNDTKTSELNHNLIERIKELNCLYGISRLIEKGNISIEKIIQGVVELVPPAWQYPEATFACIKIQDRHFRAENYQDTIWKQAEMVMVYGKPYGTIEVCYLEEKPYAYEGPFLKEERELLHVIAERLGTIIEYKIAEKTFSRFMSEKRSYGKNCNRRCRAGSISPGNLYMN